MVMDAQPSPQSVGREFVRQYYTLLNKAPNHLHRFYNNHSSFIHGGLDSHNREAILVIGQKNIHNKIQQLNFRDCHAKISQVDAQATLGNGVVVQVTGELSNDGQPMRRFTQTFVLAAQSPKNYYVHNDIFRYQDLYSDDENDGESRSENDEEQDAEQKAAVENNANQNQIGQPQQIYYTLPPHPVAPAVAALPQVGQAVPPMQPFVAQQAAQVNGVVHEELLQGMQQISQPSQIVPPPPVAVVSPQQPNQAQQPNIIPAIPNVNIPVSTTNVPVTHHNLPASLPAQESVVVAIQENTGLVPAMSHNVSTDSATNIESNIQTDIEVKKDEFKISDQIEKPEIVKPPQSEPKTYANLFKSMSNTSSSSSGFVPLPPPSSQSLSQATNKQDQLRSDNIHSSSGLPQRSSSNRQIKDFTERRQSNSNSQFNDSHQLFLGNVPHHATEEELKVLFSKFGTVIDLRIHSKPVSKVPGVRLPPNYGFITYEDPESVQNCLSNCPLYFPDNSPDGQKLNVEEKKTRMRTPNDMSRLSNNMSNAGGNVGGGNSQRSGGGAGGPNRSLSNSGGGGMMRGGPGGNGSIRNSTGGPRPSGGFNRIDSRGPSNRGGGGGGNGNVSGGGGNAYGRR